jgi:4-hydroxybenzoate polyprenyltransferase
MSGRFQRWFSLVKFGHSIFALPFALTGAWLAGGGVPTGRVLLLIAGCAVAARTAAMGFNRLLDRRIDAENPRTANRELPRGLVRPGAVLVLVVASGAAFVAQAFLLNAPSGWLSIPVLGLLLFYSAVKRFSWLAHVVLGACLAVAPLGGWLAVTGSFSGDLVIPLSLAAAVTTWVAGFDLIYACQDAEFDRAHGLHSIPARFGVSAALWTSGALHVATISLLGLLGWRADLGLAYWISLAVASGLLVWQHRLVRPDDFSRVDMAFFTLNGWVSVGLFVGIALDLATRKAVL